MCTSYTFKKTRFDRKLIFIKKGIHMNPKKKKKVCVTVLLFIIYSISVHVESPKYKMICLKPKACEFPNYFTNRVDFIMS